MFIHGLIQLYLWKLWCIRHYVGHSRYVSDMKPIDKDSVVQKEEDP